VRDSNLPAIGCTFASDEAALEGLRVLSEIGVLHSVRVGAADAQRAERIAAQLGARADLDAADPLAGIGELVTGDAASTGVNRGALFGGVVGALAGCGIGFSSLQSLAPVDPALRPIALTLLFFAIGIAVGAVLGGAFGPRPSAHAGFRLIDGMEDGAIAVVSTLDADLLDRARAALESAGANDIIVIAGR
jgi:hypothetical protein